MSKKITITKKKLDKLVQAAVEKEFDRRNPPVLTKEQKLHRSLICLNWLFDEKPVEPGSIAKEPLTESLKSDHGSEGS